jgi:hypothetical protein
MLSFMPGLGLFMSVESSGAHGLDNNPKKILLIEKNCNARNQRARFLGSHGYAVSAMQHCDEAHLIWRTLLPDLVLVAADQHREAERLLMVGHHPGFEQLAALMYSGVTSEYRGMPPAGVVVLTLPVDTAIEPGVAQLSAFWWP